MKIALIAPGLREENVGLQPWRYLTEILVGLREGINAVLNTVEGIGKHGAE